MIPIEAISKLGPDACPIILEAIFAKSSTAFAILDDKLHYVWVNNVFAAYSGIPVVEHLGKPVGETTGNESWLVKDALLDTIASGHPMLDLPVDRPQKGVYASISGLRTSYYPLSGRNNSFGVLIVIIDHTPFVETETKLLQEAIHERRSHERKLQEQEDRLELALRSGRLGTWELSLTREELVDASPTCKAAFGYSASERFSYDDLVERIHPEDLDYVLNAVQASRQSGEEYHVEYRCVWRDGSLHWVDTTALPTFDDNGRATTLIGISQDISERKNAEREKSALLAKIRDFAVLQAAFFRDVLASVTDGKLRLCQKTYDLPKRGTEVDESIILTTSSGLKDLRSEAKSAAINLGFSNERWQDLITAVSEAGMNAVVHAGGGTASLYVVNNNCVQVWIRDTGKGINIENLPRATLEKGYTTTGTMGHGMKMMLETADRVWLLTGQAGTTVVIEQDRESLKRDWL